jgi:hypothetical protein
MHFFCGFAALRETKNKSLSNLSQIGSSDKLERNLCFSLKDLSTFQLSTKKATHWIAI